MGKSKIEWTDKTWNPITGCTPVSEGCQNCYAARMAKRLAGRCGYPADDPFKPSTFHADKLEEPLKWKKPSRIFVCSMGDLFHAAVNINPVINVFKIMQTAKHHTFIILTKRPQSMLEFTDYAVEGSWPDNCWLGVTAENQQRADERIPILLQIPAAVRFVSVEPMLGPVDLTRAMDVAIEVDGDIQVPAVGPMSNWLDWVICGGETGPGARLIQSNWVRNLKDHCVADRVPFFFKHWGSCFEKYHEGVGRLLDGQEWNQYPEGGK